MYNQDVAIFYPEQGEAFVEGVIDGVVSVSLSNIVVYQVNDPERAEAAADRAELAASQAESSAANAAASASAANTSETNAASSATTATNAKNAAEAAKSAAQTSESNALTYRNAAEAAKNAAEAAASDAAASASAASTSATNAANSASAANTSKNNAATSATTATNAKNAAEAARDTAVSAKNAAEAARDTAITARNDLEDARDAALAAATQAQVHRGAAEAAADNALVSKNAAANSETAAATSASNAATSASNAATSASNAQSAKTAAEAAKTAAETAKTAAEAASTTATAIRDVLQSSYLGMHSTDPTVDLNGDPLNGGEVYVHQGTGKLRYYTGTHWEPVNVDLAELDSRIQDAIDALVGGAPGALDTLQELADALGNDPNFATTITTQLGERLLKSENLADVPDKAAARANLGANSASNLTTGTLPAARFNDTSHGNRGGGSLHAVATTTTAGFMSAADKTKLDGLTAGDFTQATIAGAATKTTPVDADSVALIDSANSNVLRRLTWANVKATLKTYFDTLYAKVGHSHAFADLTGKPTTLAGYGITDAATAVHTHATATTSADGFMSSSDKSKLDGIQAQATKNDTDANLKNRANHTGTQPISTISGLQGALDSKLSKAGDTMTGKLVLAAPTESDASLHLPDGTSPTNPDNGDLWFNGTTLSLRVNGVSRSLYHTGNLPLVSQAEAEAGVSSSARTWSAERVNQAIQALSPVKSVNSKTGAVILSAGDISGLGNSATRDVGTTSGTVAAGDDGRIVGAIQKDGSTGLKGYAAEAKALGNLSGSLTPTHVGGNYQTGTITGALTINAPTAPGVYDLKIELLIGAGAGAITLAGFSNTDFGDSFTTTSGDFFILQIEKGATRTIATVRKLT